MVTKSDERGDTLEFKAANISQPSLIKAEILAIFMAILVTISNANINIYTDSVNAIAQFYKYKKEKIHRKKTKFNQYVT